MAEPRGVWDEAGRLRLLLEIDSELSAAESPEAVLRVLAARTLAFAGAERALIVERAPGGRYRVTHAASREGGPEQAAPELSWSIVREVFRSRAPRTFFVDAEGAEVRATASILALDLKAVMCAPILTRPGKGGEAPRVDAVLYVDSRARTRIFDARDLEFFSMLVEHAGFCLENARLLQALREESEGLAREMRARYHFGKIIGESPVMREVYRSLRELKDVDVDVLITGETGTGKELVAKALHFSGRRAAGPFVEVSAAALPLDLVEAELFGVAGRVATGVRPRLGRFEQARGGTLFLDEIGEMPLEIQIKILRFLQDRRVRRVGAVRESTVDVRLVAATNKDLQQAVREGRFREDLLFRLNAITIHLPPLRERGEDVLLLAREFLQRFSAENDLPARVFSPEAEQWLLAHPWPGNVRELIRVVQRAALLCRGPRVLPEHLGGVRGTPSSLQDYPRRRKELERRLILQALEDARGNVSAAARSLGISRKTLYVKLREHGIPTRRGGEGAAQPS
jgi:DNA-binding NtrC family response regulator